MSQFIHLNAHSSHSLLEGVPSVKDLAKKAAELGMPALGITDSLNMFAAVEVSLKLPEAGVQPILGVQLGFSLDGSLRGEPCQLTLLAQNEVGYKNLLQLSSKAYLDTPEGEKPQVNLDVLLAYHEGIILLTGGAKVSPVCRLLLQKEEGQAEELLKQLAQTFESRTYIELQRHGWAEEDLCEPKLLEWAEKHHLPLVATNDCRFISPSNSEAFDVMLCIGEGVTLDDPRRPKFTPEHYFKSPEEMVGLFKDVLEAVENTVNIAKRCAIKVPTDATYMPAWREEGDNALDPVERMKKEAEIGLKWRLDEFVLPTIGKDKNEEEITSIIQQYEKRLTYEIGIIEKMGYAGYFLITSDFIRWSKENDIPVGPGRGSGAGSLVAYCLQITDIDPIVWDLYFERFLNPDRVSLPDFDIDFCQDRRDEVIRYVRDKYGADSVTQIITFGTLKARACIRDVGRVLQMHFNDVGRIAAFIPEGPASIPIEKALAEDERLKELYDTDEDVQRLLDIAMQLEGAYRHASVHAAGIHIADRPITEIAPLYKDPRSDMPATAWSWLDSEIAGLVKFDFLGLKTLTVVKHCVDLLKNRGIDIDVLKLPMDDEETLKMLQAGHTVGVFQVESRGMTDFLKRIVPDRFQYLSDVIALYRPGPLGSGMADDFIECRHGRKDVVYPHPALEPVLNNTFGVPVYQEQVMRMAQVMAGYSLGQADMLRRAMGKKKPEEMAKHRQLFRDGAADIHGLSEAEADKIFDLMENFAGYGFNKAHTIAYAFVSWQTAYLKAHYPLEFMAASMTLDRHNDQKVLKFKRELERMQVDLLAPDVNASARYFTVEGEAIRFALTAIKGAGEEAMQAMVNEREENGPYKDIYDFLSRQQSGVINRKQLEVLVKAGALDGLEENRAKLWANMDTLLAYAQSSAEEKNSNQIGLFGGGGEEQAATVLPTLKDAAPWDPFQKLEYEQQVFGFYLSAHPLDAYEDTLATGGFTPLLGLFERASGGYTEARIACIVHAKREMKTKSGKRMAFLAISDPSGQEEIVLFPEAYEKYQELVGSGQPLYMELQIGMDGERMRANAESVRLLDEHVGEKQAYVTFKLENLDVLQPLQELLDQNVNGATRCELHYTLDDGRHVEIKLKRKFSLGRKAQVQLESLPGISMLAE